MIASQTGEITFYEELGVDPTASAEEIHDAFRALVRLLHPDQQTDPLLKVIAEKQMRKMNQVYAVLSDPDRRRRYDETLAEDDFPPAIILDASVHPNLGRLIGRIAWIAAILVSAGLLVWLTSQNSASVPQARSRDQTPASGDSASLVTSPGQSTPPSSETERLRSRVRSLTVERDAAVEELTRLRGTSSSSAPSPANAPPVDTPVTMPSPVVALTELPSSSKLSTPPAPAPVRVEPVANRQLAGFWFYNRPSRGQRNKNEALYPPEYIEAAITEENGTLRGKYRSRFQIVDRAISPDVNFSFSGVSANGSTVTCPWTGPGGARGEITLTLMPNNSMRVDWTASELGNQMGLSSGTAILTRRIE
jgi:curved DNA-binding protein CbpA